MLVLETVELIFGLRQQVSKWLTGFMVQAIFDGLGHGLTGYGTGWYRFVWCMQVWNGFMQVWNGFWSYWFDDLAG